MKESEDALPSSKITLSPNTLTSMAPLARSTNLVKISRIALLRALISMAQTPSTADFWCVWTYLIYEDDMSKSEERDILGVEGKGQIGI